MTDLERFDKLTSIQRKRYAEIKSDKELSPYNIDFIMFLVRRTDLIWLIAELKVKADEYNRRTGKDITEQLVKIKALEDMEVFFNKLQERFDLQQMQIDQQQRLIELLRKKLPKIKYTSKELLLNFINPDKIDSSIIEDDF